MQIQELDADTFADTLGGWDGLSIVEFYAPWCRTCRGVEPTYKRMVAKMSSDPAYSNVRFFKVNFKENKQLCLKERVYALPAVHFYTPALGRINRFTLTAVSAAKTLRQETDRYVGSGDGDEGHLALLKSLQASSPRAISPLARFSTLAAFLHALVNVQMYIDALGEEDGAVLGEVMASDERRVGELRDVFNWMDLNHDGLLDADELAAVARAVGSFAGDGAGGVDGASDTVELQDFYSTLLDHASASIAATDDGSNEMGDATASDTSAGATLDFGSFAYLMTSKAVTEYRKPNVELAPAFRALDANGDGVITKEEMLQAMACVGRNLPGDGDDWAREAARAFDVIDVDRSGTLDYEEFVAVMSGHRESPYAV